MAHIALKIDPPYDKALAGILSFSSLADAEQTLRRLENLCRNYRAASDKKGVDYCRQIALLGRRRAEIISRNRRVSPQKRRQKQEVATWFRIWLETPAVFDEWLAMRKSTEAFKNLVESEDSNRSRSGDRHA